MASFSRDLHEFCAVLMGEIGRLSDRVKDLEKHVDERNGVIDQLTDEPHQSRGRLWLFKTAWGRPKLTPSCHT